MKAHGFGTFASVHARRGTGRPRRRYPMPVVEEHVELLAGDPVLVQRFAPRQADSANVKRSHRKPWAEGSAYWTALHGERVLVRRFAAPVGLEAELTAAARGRAIGRPMVGAGGLFEIDAGTYRAGTR